MHETPELLAPAGGWDCLRAAAANGADAVYFGLPKFNARMRADNFTDEELPRVVKFCHSHGVKAYVAFNTLVFTDELDAAAAQLRLLNHAGVDALIVQDIGLVRLAREIVPELRIHASTQMTITSPEGAEFARSLGIERIVLARELSLREIKKFGMRNAECGTEDIAPRSEFRAPSLEVFVHGALCVAYSGQCLTSESLGQRSANRGECAQACRMPYELVVDGVTRDLGDKRYLLSPQDLAAVNEIPALIELGVVSFKIEGRLKSPEYVAAVTQVYRKAIDAALEKKAEAISDADRYKLEMTFSRGLFTGWMHGVNHQELVSARFGKKRGPFAGMIARVGKDFVEIESQTALKPGDGIVFDTGGDTNAEQGGRIYEIRGRRLFFKHDHIDFTKLAAGDRMWKTDDPALNAELRKSFAGKIAPRKRLRVDLVVRGRAGEPMIIECAGAGTASATSTMPLQAARTAPLTVEKLREHLGRFGETIFELGELENAIEGGVILPIGEMNRLRRELVFQLDAQQQITRHESPRSAAEIVAAVCDRRHSPAESVAEEKSGNGHKPPPQLAVLCRTTDQVEAALDCGVSEIYADFEDIRRYRDVVASVRRCDASRIFLATPRIQKAGEEGFFKLIENAEPDGVLIRNLGAIDFFSRNKSLRKIGDFSLNVANPLTADFFLSHGLDRLTVSYDLNIEQVLALLEKCPRGWFELTIHQHMPMFHMEHCVFAAFMSKGTTFLDCGRPCETHRVHLRDRVGVAHPLRADVGCRNTLFNAVPQTGAQFFGDLLAAGLRHFRVELLEENAAESHRVIAAYQSLLRGGSDGGRLWRELNAQSQLGVTRGTYAVENPTPQQG